MKLFLREAKKIGKIFQPSNKFSSLVFNKKLGCSPFSRLYVTKEVSLRMAEQP